MNETIEDRAGGIDGLSRALRRRYMILFYSLLLTMLTVPAIRRMAALPGSGVRSDQVLAIAQAFEKLMEDTDGNRAGAAKK